MRPYWPRGYSDRYCAGGADGHVNRATGPQATQRARPEYAQRVYLALSLTSSGWVAECRALLEEWLEPVRRDLQAKAGRVAGGQVSGGGYRGSGGAVSFTQGDTRRCGDETFGQGAVGRGDGKVLSKGAVTPAVEDDLHARSVGHARNASASGESTDPVDVGLQDVADAIGDHRLIGPGCV